VRWTDRILGVVLGIILGVGVVAVFVFVYSERTVDAPSISGTAKENGGQAGGRQAPRTRPSSGEAPLATIRVVAGAPPPSGPPVLQYRKGDQVRLRIISDETVLLQALGLGISVTAPAGRPVTREFRASEAGDFPLVVAASHIDVARISIGGRDRAG
jgi:hypothetical protein